MLISFKDLRICKTYFYYQILSVAVYVTFPINPCEALSDLALARCYNIVMAFSHCFYLDSFLAVGLTVYLSFYVRPHIYFVDSPLGDFFGTVVFQIIGLLLVRLLIQIVGNLYVEAEIMRKGN